MNENLFLCPIHEDRGTAELVPFSYRFPAFSSQLTKARLLSKSALVSFSFDTLKGGFPFRVSKAVEAHDCRLAPFLRDFEKEHCDAG